MLQCVNKMHPSACYLTANTKTQQIAVADMRENQWTFLMDFISSNNFANSGSFAKVSVPVQFLVSMQRADIQINNKGL